MQPDAYELFKLLEFLQDNGGWFKFEDGRWQAGWDDYHWDGRDNLRAEFFRRAYAELWNRAFKRGQT
jgi:hypothetical protein